MADLLSTRVEKPPLLQSLHGKLSTDASWSMLDRNLSGGPQRELSLVRFQSVQNTARILQLDHTQSSWSILSYVVAFLLLIVVPIFKLVFVKADTEMRNDQLVFQPVVIIVGVSRSVVSFVFLAYAIRIHGLNGILFLDSVAEEVAQVRKDYDTVVELGSTLLIKLFVPSFIIYMAQLTWLYSRVDFKPLPFNTSFVQVELIFTLFMTTLSWMFQTTTYLYACVLFWKVCKLQELKMRQYYEMLNQGLETEYYVMEYERIKRDLKNTSHRFRSFLAFTFFITVSGALISMYEVVDSINDGLALCLWGELVVLTVVNLTGAWLCLRCSSKIAHLHKRIYKRAASVHAKQTLGSPLTTQSAPLTKIPTIVQSAPLFKISEDGGSNQAALERLENYCQRQDAWARRAAVVEYLSGGDVGISVYGFILDRFFVHTSIGALLTTTWFILGRSLGG
ncbi:unnamed protein product [Calypogeia fissa]